MSEPTPVKITLTIELIDLDKNDVKVNYNAFGTTKTREQFLHTVLVGIDELIRMYKTFCVEQEKPDRGPDYIVHWNLPKDVNGERK
jgi:hypothetical protein